MVSSKKIIWIIVIALIGLCALWFVIQAGYEVYSYFQMSTRTEVSIDKWSVEEKKSNHFAVMADYSYVFQGKTYQGRGQVGNYYPNPWAAHEAEKRFSSQKWSAWIDPQYPDRSALEKHFPIKKTLSALVLIGLAVYFLILGFYMKVKHG